MPKLIRLRSSIEVRRTIITPEIYLTEFRTFYKVDQAIQEFASSICQENSMNYSDADYNLTAINADGIYLATCSALLLCLQLMKAGHYEDLDVSWKS